MRFGTLLLAGACLAAGPDIPPLRVAVSDRVVLGVNLSDASAAMAVWSRELLKTTPLVLDTPQNWVQPSDQLLASVRAGKVDLFCLSVQEYRQVSRYVDTSRIIADDHGGEELLLVVRDGNGVGSLADLRGRTLVLQDSPNTSVAEAWLAVSLWREGLGAPRQFLGRLTRQTKLSQVVLPLYFGQIDACVVSRRGLDTMLELNPQLERRLKVLLVSPRLVSAIFAVRTDYPVHLKKPIFDRLLGLKSSPATRQLLTLYQSPGFSVRDESCLGPVNSLLEIYERHLETPTVRNR